MSTSRSQSHELLSPAGLPPVAPMPRRTLRKGTHSCAECKRRKTRCFFEPRAAKCVGCQRRSTQCISQEFVDVVPAGEAREDPQVAESLGRMQQMLERIMQKTTAEESAPVSSDVSAASVSPRAPAGGVDTPQSSPAVASAGPRATQASSKNASPLLPIVSVSRPPASPAFPASPPSRHAELSHDLHAAFPSQHDVSVLFAAGRIAIYLQALCNPYQELFAEGNTRSLEIMSDLPPQTAHPVLLARKHLHIALCIQQLDPGCRLDDLQDADLSRHRKDAMRRHFSLATSRVTCHEDLLDSLEGLECLICEAVYLVNSGNLRRALLALRRALTMAQFMGFHVRTGPKAMQRSFKQYDPSTRVSGAVTWVHLAWLERLLSLLLGIPTAVTGPALVEGLYRKQPAGKPAKLEKPASETCSEWVEKLQVDLSDAILRCHQSSGQRGDYSETQRIDDRLNELTECLPASWWSPLDDVLLGLGNGSVSMEDLMERMISAQIQIVHFCLILLLHLPYLLRQPVDTSGPCAYAAYQDGQVQTTAERIRYSKSACTFACRQVLRCFIQFRAIVRVVFCCRPVDFCALTACIVLLVAHLGGSRRQPGPLGQTLAEDNDGSWLLPHHRLDDRALVQRTIETVDELNRINDDELSRETADLARRLLNLETRCVQEKTAYHASDAAKDGLQHLDHLDHLDAVPALSTDGQPLLLRIPYFGTVRLLNATQSSPPASLSSTSSAASQPRVATDGQDTQYGGSWACAAPNAASSQMEPPLFSMAAEQNYDWLLGRLPDMTPPSSDMSGTLSDPAFSISTTAAVGSQGPEFMLTNADQLPFMSYDPMGSFQGEPGDLGYGDVPMPDLTAGADSWAFQGVDATVFDNLFRGANFPV